MFTRAGDEFVPAAAVQTHTATLPAVERSTARTVGFLDCSRTADLTSLVLLGARDGENLAELDTFRIEVWDPKRSPMGRVRYSEIRDALESLLPCFPRLLELRVDVTASSDAQDLVDHLRRLPGGRRVEPWHADRRGNRELWDALERRLLGDASALRIPDHARLQKELRALRIKPQGSGFAVVDPTNSHARLSTRSRGRAAGR